MAHETNPDRVVVVGASMGGLRAAEAVAKAGYEGEIEVIGAEAHPPYNRPPLSKDALRTEPDVAALTFRIPRAAQAVQWRLGRRVVTSDLDAGTVTLDDGDTVSWRGLVAATGLRARRLSVPGPTDGRFVVRTVDDAARLRAALIAGVRLVIVGAGFIGCEVAATARALGAEVDVIAPGPVPMHRPLGRDLGAELQRRHEARGVRFHLETVPVAFGGDSRVDAVQLSDGSAIPADLVVEAIGCEPEIDWMHGNGLDLGDGLLCDNALRVEGRPDVVACGDLARFPNPLFDDIPRRVEHWTMVTDTARRAGHSLGTHLIGAPLLGDPMAASGGFRPIPSFWSDQYDIRLQSFGAVNLGGGDIRVLEGDLSGEVAVGYYRDGQLVGVVLIGLGGRHAHYRAQFAAPADATLTS